MSKEFEAWWKNKTESDYAFRCYHKDSVEALQAAFTAGRTLGRREVKGEAQSELFHYHDDKNCCCDRSVNYVCDVCVALDACAAAIESIPEDK